MQFPESENGGERLAVWRVARPQKLRGGLAVTDFGDGWRR